MKTLFLLTMLILSANALPNGFYKQEYQFKKSSSTFKNNQLETKNDDEGYYGKQGDLDGTSSPQVEQHNQHSEFVSPNVDGLGHSLTSYNDRDLTPEAERAFRDHNLNPGTIGQRAYSISSSNNGYQSGSYGQHRPTYTTQSNLGQVTQNLQYDMAQQVREAVRSMHGQSSYGTTQMRGEDMQYLEDQLKANITRQLQAALQQRYGHQTTRGASSYSLSSGSAGYNPSANYDTNELDDLKQQMERDLMKQLHDGARTAYSKSSSSSSSSSYHSSYGGGNMGTSTIGSGNRHVHRDSAEIDDLNRHGSRPSSHYRPYQPSTDDLQRPERISYGSNTQPSAASQTAYGSNYGSRYGSTYESQSAGTARQTYSGSNYERDFPSLSSSQIVVNPSQTVTNVVQGVQNDVSEQIRTALRAYQAKYLSSSYTLTNSRPDFQVALDDLKRELRYNLTRKLTDELERSYGRQDVRGEYSFSQNSRNNANYRTADLDDLKKQAEDNLINYLETSFRNYETNYQQIRTQYINSQRDHSHQSPQYTHSLTSDTAQNPNYVRYEPGPYPGKTSYRSQSSYSASSSYSGGAGDTQHPQNSQLNQIRNQLQADLQRQLQAAVYEQKSHSSYSTQSIGQVEQLLTDELKTNLTRRLQETLNEHYGKQGVRGGQSYTVSASGVYYPNANYRTEDLSALQKQLQDDLVRNLQEQLNQQGSSYNSQYSASSSYAPSSNRYQGSTRFTNKPPSDMEGQVVDDIGQQTIDETGQQTEDLDSLVQKHTNDFGTLEVGSHSKPIRGDIGQANDNLSQQTEDEEDYGQLDLESSTRNKNNSYLSHLGVNIEQREDDTDLDNKSMNKTQAIGQQTEEFGQEIDDLDDVLQKPVDEFGQIELGSANRNYGNLAVANQQVDNNYNKFRNRAQEIGQQAQDLGQQIEDLSQQSDFDGQTQQQIEDDFGQIVVDSNKHNGSLQIDNQITGNRNSFTNHRIPQTYQQQVEDDYEDGLVLGVKPLSSSSSTSTSTSTSTTTEYVPYGVYRNRYYPYRHNSGSYVRPQSTSYSSYMPYRRWQTVDGPESMSSSTSTSTTARPLNVHAQNQQIDDLAAQMAETQQTQDGFNDFINHGDYLQHAPQVHDLTLSNQNQQNNDDDDDTDLTHQHQLEENFDDLFQQPEQENVRPTLSLSDVHRAYIGQTQYANAPNNPNSQFRTIPTQSQVPAYQSNYNQQEPDDFQQQQRVQPLYISSNHPRTRTTYTLGSSTPTESTGKVNETATIETEQEQGHSNSLESVSEEEAVTEVVKPLGFWKRVGGKITDSYNTVKQKAKDLIG